MRKQGVSRLDSADLARRRVIRNWTRIFAVLTAVLLACSIALVPLHWEVDSRLESALTKDTQLLQNLREPTSERLMSQFGVAVALQNDKVGDPLSAEDREAMRAQRVASRTEARTLYSAQEEQLRDRSANASTLELYHYVLSLQERMYESELIALKNSSAFFATSEQYLLDIVDL
ncbi:MAG: hypothetical protein MHM6MM_009185, partial [Cercozoa sp. M6MM]